jgi:hypothetical protein
LPQIISSKFIQEHYLCDWLKRMLITFWSVDTKWVKKK